MVWMSDYIPYFYGDVIIHPCFKLSSMVVSSSWLQHAGGLPSHDIDIKQPQILIIVSWRTYGEATREAFLLTIVVLYEVNIVRKWLTGLLRMPAIGLKQIVNTCAVFLISSSRGTYFYHHYDIMTWKCFLHHWPFVCRIHQWIPHTTLKLAMQRFRSDFAINWINLLNK